MQSYETDVIAWANEQAAFIRAGRFEMLDIKRKEIAFCMKETPSLKTCLLDPDWLDVVWSKAVAQAVSETGLDVFPEFCPWDFEQIININFWPEL